MSFKNFKSYIKDYFSFTNRERRPVLILITIIILLSGGLFYLRFVKSSTTIDFSAFENEIAAFEKRLIEDSIQYAAKKKHPVSAKNFIEHKLPASEIFLFDFNPNNLHDTLWLRLGISEKTIRTIKNYEVKGGKFYKKEDVKKIYGFSKDDYKRLEPYIVIPEKISVSGKDSIPHSVKFLKKPEQSVIIFDLNLATAEELKTLKDIGDFRANSIIKYRNYLGGYVAKEQLLEAFGIEDSLYQEIKDRFEIKTKITRSVNINSNNEIDLKHPYISRQLAKVMISYRKMHGDFKEVNDIRKLPLVNDELFQKLLPYLSTE